MSECIGKLTRMRMGEGADIFSLQVTRLRLQRGGSPEAAVAAAVGKAAEEAQKRLIVEAEGLRAQLNSTSAGSRYQNVDPKQRAD